MIIRASIKKEKKRTDNGKPDTVVIELEANARNVIFPLFSSSMVAMKHQVRLPREKFHAQLNYPWKLE